MEATALDGNVTLTGTVGYGQERAAAERAVSGLVGLRNVRNDIEISYDVESPVDVDLHVQLLGFIPSSLIPKGGCQVRHAAQSVRMFSP